jgi:hypothetical protein
VGRAVAADDRAEGKEEGRASKGIGVATFPGILDPPGQIKYLGGHPTRPKALG